MKFFVYAMQKKHKSILTPYVGDFLNTAPHPDKSRILNYLENGIPFLASSAKFMDVLDVNNSKMIKKHYSRGGVWRTDGEWVWNDEIVYYIEKYNVSVPSEFVLHMKKNDWTIHENIVVDKKRLKNDVYSVIPDDDLWRIIGLFYSLY